LTFFAMASTNPTEGERTEVEDCYSEQRRLEEELLASGLGEEEVADDVNPSLLDISMEDSARETAGVKPNPTMGGNPATTPNPIRGVEGSQSIQIVASGGGGGKRHTKPIMWW
jgi:hypothetical protein